MHSAMPPSDPAFRRGFTLLEVLLALALLALVISLVQGAYSGVARSEKESRRRTGQAHGSAFMAHHIADELAMVFADPSRPAATGLVVETDTDGVSSLAFSSRVPPRYGFSSGGEAEIGYLAETGDDGGLNLTRREDTDLDGVLAGGGQPYIMLSGIRRFEIRCYNEDRDEWVDAWDSVSPPGSQTLPAAMEVSIVWGEGEDADGELLEQVYRTRTVVYGR